MDKPQEEWESLIKRLVQARRKGTGEKLEKARAVIARQHGYNSYDEMMKTKGVAQTQEDGRTTNL